MAKQIKIKDIAQLAKVSAGTVDRILHNRGNVSAESREKVEKVLAKVGYKFNIHASAVSLKKSFKIIISIPSASIGEYWGSIQTGFERALEEFCDVDIRCSYSFYNQFDAYSCENAFSHICEEMPDAVIIGPTFIEPTKKLCEKLDKAGIVYTFVDSVIDGCHPLATFTTDQYSCGKILAKILNNEVSDGDELAVFRSMRIGNYKSFNSSERKRGFDDMISAMEKESGKKRKVWETSFSVLNTDENDEQVRNFLQGHPNVKGIAVMNSRGHIIADLLESQGINDIAIVSFDLTYNNKRVLKSGYIRALLCQRPELQGFQAIKTVIMYLMYKQKEETVHHKMPIDIILKENLPFYRQVL